MSQELALAPLDHFSRLGFAAGQPRTGLWLTMFVTCMLWSTLGSAQISPPGLGSAKTASWAAVGLRQDLDAIQRRESMTYVGLGRVSDLDDANMFKKSAILVLNQEFYDQFHANFLYSLAVSYRRQNRYEDEPPFARADPAVKQELRFYGRYSHVLKLGAFKFVNTVRPELRTFFGNGLGSDEEAFEFRFRMRSQTNWTMDKPGVHRLVASAEVLSAVAKERSGKGSDFGYRESRFCFYYAIAPKHVGAVFDVGYMNNLLGSGQSLVDVHYLAFDVIWENPFGRVAQEAP